MATAEELLAGVTTVDKTLIISNDLRTISIPPTVTNLGVESDNDILRLKFKMSRYIGDVDLSAFSIRINYVNAQGESDVYTVSDATTTADHISFSWLVGPTATRYKGETRFNVCLVMLTSDGEYVDREFNTTVATMKVLEGLEVDESLVEEYSDLIEQWRRELFGIGDTEEAVTYTPQTLTEEQKAQARENIGAVSHSEAEDYASTADPDRHAKYFTITDDGVVSLKPEYRGALPTSRSSFTDAISDNGLEVAGSKNSELPEHLVIPEVVDEITVVSLAAGMFMYNEGIRCLTVPRFITAIPDQWVRNAIYLQQLYGTENVVSIGTSAFYATQLEKASFPNLTSLGIYAFAVCPFMKYIDIGKINTITTYAFSCCEMLTSIKGGENVTKIDASGLEKTKRLNNAVFMPKLETIGNGAFLGSRMHYDWDSLTNCTFGTNATAKQLNPTDIWSACTITPCENPVPTLLAQHDERWATRQIGTSGKTYAEGCALMAAMHAYCGLHGLTFSSVIDFENHINNLYPNALNNFSSMTSTRKQFLESIGLTVVEYNTITQSVLQTLYDALAEGKYAVVAIPTNPAASTWHETVIYGVKENGELLIADSDPSFYSVGESEKAMKFAIRYQNYIKSNQSPLWIVSL